MHFMNPPPLMKLVEIIRGLQTSDETWTDGASSWPEGLRQDHGHVAATSPASS